MADPVTTGAVANAATGAVGTATDAVSSAASGIAESTGNWLTNMITAPFRAIAEVPGRLFSAVGGAAKGIFGSLWNGVMATGVITGLKLLSPELWRAAETAIGGDTRAQRTAAMVQRDGIGGVVLDSAMQGFGLAAAGGALSGAIGSGGMLAGGALVAGVGAVALGALTPATPAGSGGRATGEARNT